MYDIMSVERKIIKGVIVMSIIKFVSLVVAIIYGVCIVGNVKSHNAVGSGYIILFAVSTATFIFTQFNLF